MWSDSTRALSLGKDSFVQEFWTKFHWYITGKLKISTLMCLAWSQYGYRFKVLMY